MRGQLVLIFGISLYFGLALLFYWFGIGGEYNELLKRLIYVGSPGVATLAGLYTLVKYGRSGPRSLVLLFLMLGCGSFFVAEVLWTLFLYVLHIDPYPSIADLFYIGAYQFLLIGFIV